MSTAAAKVRANDSVVAAWLAIRELVNAERAGDTECLSREDLDLWLKMGQHSAIQGALTRAFDREQAEKKGRTGP